MLRSGKYAYVEGIGCTQAWGFGRQSSVARYFASCVPGASGATEGVLDETGFVRGLGYDFPMPSEDPLAFAGVASAKPGQLVNYEGEVLISDVTLNIPVSAGTPINWSANFGVMGHLEKNTTNTYHDETRVPAASGKNGRVTIEGTLDSDTFTEVERVQAITLAFRRPASTSVADGETERDTGNLEVDLSFEVHNDDMEVALYELNNTNRVRVYVTPTLFFEFDAIVWNAHQNFQVDRSSNPPPIIGYTVSGIWTALREQDPGALGKILLPSGYEYYGEGST